MLTIDWQINICKKVHSHYVEVVLPSDIKNTKQIDWQKALKKGVKQCKEMVVFVYMFLVRVDGRGDVAVCWWQDVKRGGRPWKGWWCWFATSMRRELHRGAFYLGSICSHPCMHVSSELQKMRATDNLFSEANTLYVKTEYELIESLVLQKIPVSILYIVYVYVCIWIWAIIFV